MQRRILFSCLMLLVFSVVTTAQWEKIPLYGGHAERLRQSKFNPNDIFALTAKSGVWYSSDGGDNWRPMNGDNNDMVGREVNDLEVAKDGSIFIVADSRLFRSTDWGRTWIETKARDDVKLVYYSNIETTIDGTLMIYCISRIVLDKNYLLVSVNFSSSWTELSLPKEANWRFMNFYVDPNNINNILLFGAYGFMASTINRGADWKIADNFNEYFSIYHPTKIIRNNSIIYGLWTYRDGNPDWWYDYFESENLGATWIKKNANKFKGQPSLDRIEIFVIPIRNEVLITPLGNSFYRSTDHGVTWNGDMEHLLWDIIYTENKLLGSFTLTGISFSSDNGYTWEVPAKGIGFSAFSTIEFGAATSDIFFSIVKDQIEGNARYELRQSTDRGGVWKTLFGSPSINGLRVSAKPEIRYFTISTGNSIISGVLDQSNPDTLLRWEPSQIPTILISQYYDLKISGADKNEIYLMAATIDGRKLFSSSDAGATWVSHDIPPYAYRYFEIYPSNLHPGWLVGIGGPSINTEIIGMGIWLTTDYGSSWRLVRNTIPDNDHFQLIGADLLYNANGFLFSTNYGSTWTKNVIGLKDDQKSWYFPSFNSNGNLHIARFPNWYLYRNDQWIEIKDNAGNSMNRSAPEYLHQVGNDLYGCYPNDGLYRLKSTNVTGIPDVPNASDFSLSQNFPNPFKENTTFIFTSPTNKDTEIMITNSMGKIVRQFHITIEDSNEKFMRWDGTDENSIKLPSGSYLISILSDDRIISRKVTLLK